MKAYRPCFFEFHPESLDPEKQDALRRYIQHVYFCELSVHIMIIIRRKDGAKANCDPFFEIRPIYFTRVLQS